MQRKQQVGECWVCVIFFARLALVSATLHRGGFRGSAPEKKKIFPRETCHIFASFFMSPRFSCPLLGSFSAHGFCRWFSISVKELGLLTNPGHWVRVLDATGSYMYIVL
jgi:hypothetical protein